MFDRRGSIGEVTMATVPLEETVLPCVVRGYHKYKTVWDSYEGNSFTTKHEHNNRHNKYATAVIPVDSKDQPVVGYLLRDITKECCLFILHGGIILWRWLTEEDARLLNHEADWRYRVY